MQRLRNSWRFVVWVSVVFLAGIIGISMGLWPGLVAAVMWSARVQVIYEPKWDMDAELASILNGEGV